MSDRVGVAAAAVDADAFMLDEDGRQLRQTTAVEVVLRRLRLLDVRRGGRVLEIGTGSGFSTALLAHLTGPDGWVVSVDIDPTLVARARALLAAHGVANTTLLARDGIGGAAEHGPYDHVIAWTSPSLLPDTWVAQGRAGAAIVLPLPVAAVERSTLAVRARIDEHGHPQRGACGRSGVHPHARP